jgi:hypothetical protein
MVVLDDGNVGIGTTSPSVKLQVDGTISSTGTLTAYTSVPSINIGHDGATAFIAATSGGGANSGISFSVGNNNEKMRITSDGNVGIGTSTPSYKLDVAGNIIARTTYPSIYVDHSGTILGGVRADATVKLELKTLTTAPLSFQVNSDEKMRITDSGTVGIGTYDPTARLHVKGIGATSATTALRVENTNASASLVVLDNGAVGVGASPTTGSFDVRGTTVVGTNSGGPLTGIGINFNPIISASSNFNTLIGLNVAPVYNTGSFTNHAYLPIVAGNFSVNDYGWVITPRIIATADTFINILDFNAAEGMLVRNLSVMNVGYWFANGHLRLANEATYVDNGYRFQINSSGSASGSLYITGSSNQTLLEIDSPAVNNILYVSGSGNIGIGTSTPISTLDVYGSPRFYGDGNHMYTRIFSGASNKDSKILFGNDSERFNVGLAASSNNFAINSSNGGTPTSINIDYTTGNVLIGTTTDAGYKLDVNGSARVQGNLLVDTLGTNNAATLGGTLNLISSIAVINNAQTLYIPLLTRNTTGSEVVYDFSNVGSITATGNVGIGKTTSNAKLDVSGSAIITGSLVVNDGLANLIDTVGYTLGDTNSVVSVGWGDRRLIHSGGGVAIYWDTPNQQQSVEVSRAYLKSTPDINAQENFSAGAFNAEGRILQGVSFNGASDYDYVYLDRSAGEWMPVNNVTDRATKMLGIAFDVGGANRVLTNGSVTVTNTPGTYSMPGVDTLEHGIPIYLSSSAYATKFTPTSSGEYVRILGHAYYQNTNDVDVWVMDFRPDHTWVQL